MGQLPTMYLRQAGLTRNPTFSYLYSVRCRGQGVASEAPLERKYSRCMPGAKKSRRRDDPDNKAWFTQRTRATLNNDFLDNVATFPDPAQK
jgi:hypothetical protein